MFPDTRCNSLMDIQEKYMKTLVFVRMLRQHLKRLQEPARDATNMLLQLQKQMIALKEKDDTLRQQNDALKHEIVALRQLLPEHEEKRQNNGESVCSQKDQSANCRVIAGKDIVITSDLDFNSLQPGDDQWSNKIFQLLRSHDMAFTLMKHDAVFTCEQASKFDQYLHGASCKNLFLTDKKKKHYFVLSALEATQFRINDLKKKIVAQHQEIKCGNLQFAKESTLNSRLKLVKGSVTPFGILNDSNKETVLLIDENLMRHEYAKFHPLVNTMTISIKVADFVRLLQRLAYSYYIVKVD